MYYFLNTIYPYDVHSNLFNLEEDNKDDKPITLNDFIARVIKYLSRWYVRIQINEISHRLYCVIDKGNIIIDSLGITKTFFVDSIVKLDGRFINKQCIITLTLDRNTDNVFSRLHDCITYYDEDILRRIRNYIRQLPFVKYSFELLEQRFSIDLAAYVGNIDFIRKGYVDDCSFVIESVNAEKLSDKNLHLAIDNILQLPNYKDIFERNVKLINDKEVYIITFKLP